MGTIQFKRGQSANASSLTLANGEPAVTLDTGDLYIGITDGIAHINATMTAATSDSDGAKGLVPAPASGDRAKYLRGDGTWATPTNTTYSVMTGATSSAAGAKGLVPAPAAGDQAKYLRGDGTWVSITSVSGNAGTATKLATARTISLSGDATGSATFDGSANATISVTVNDDSHNHIISNVDGLQTALDAKQATITGAATTITSDNLTASMALMSDSSGKVAASTVTATELGYVSGVTSKIQTQLNAKAPLASPTLTGTPKAPTATAGTNTTQIATTAFVQTAVEALLAAKDAFRFVGTLAAGDTLPAADAGCVYRITSDGTINGLTVHEGDTLTCCVDNTAAETPANWFITHTNHDGQVMGPTSAVNNRVAVFDGTTGKLIKDSGYTIATSVPSGAKFTDTVYTHPTSGVTAGSYGDTSAQTPAYGATFNVPSLTVDANGHVTAAGSHTVKIPAAPTSVSGNAGTATKLATARVINGMSFDGTANTINYGTCSTAAATAAKVVNCSNFSLITGAEITVKFTVTNTASSPTLNVNSTGAKSIYYRGSAISAGYLAANRTYTFRYDGTQYELVGDINTDTNTDTKVNVTLATTTKAYLLGTSTTPTSTAAAVTAVADTGVYLDTTAGKLTATSFAGSGASLTSLNASNLSSGTVAAARLPAATTSALGAVKVGTGLAVASGVISIDVVDGGTF